MTIPKKVELKEAHVQRLLGDILALPTEPVGDCLSAYEASGYVLGELEEWETARVEEHFRSCSRCAERLDQTFAGLRALDGKIVMFPKRVGQRIVASAKIAARAELAAAAASEKPSIDEESGETPDGSVAWRAEEYKGRLAVSFEARERERVGTTVAVRWGDVRKEAVLEERAGFVQATIVFEPGELDGVTGLPEIEVHER